jgi:hypothetical protein
MLGNTTRFPQYAPMDAYQNRPLGKNMAAEIIIEQWKLYLTLVTVVQAMTK